MLQEAFVYNPLRILEKDLEEGSGDVPTKPDLRDEPVSVRGSVHPDALVPSWVRETLQSVEVPVYKGDDRNDDIKGELDYEVEIGPDGSVLRFAVLETDGLVFEWRWEKTELFLELPTAVE